MYYMLTIKNPDGGIARFGNMAGVFDYETFDELTEAIKRFDEYNSVNQCGWDFVISKMIIND